MNRPCRAIRPVASLLRMAASLLLSIGLASATEVWAQLEDASIGDYVWYDQNGDGTQGTAESGISGVIVYLDLDDNGIRHPHEPFATTDAEGAYDFIGLAAGTYVVRIDRKTVPDGFYLTTANLPLTVVLAESQDYDGADFGYDDDPENASIGDYVWLDQDADRTQDTSEAGIPGINVFLDLNDSAALDPGEPFATTDAGGAYDITGLAAGTYSVRVDGSTVPTGYDLTTANVPLTVRLAESEDYNDADFGYDDDPENASIGDYVWFDQNGDGIQDTEEVGLSGITVFLDLDEDTVLDAGEPSTATNITGTYEITGLAAGTYSARVDDATVPTGYDLTTANMPLIVILTESQHYNDADFGYDGDPEDASIGDYVWLDQDADGIQDSEEVGIAGVTVFLDLNDNAALDPGEPFTATDASGAYDISGLATGTYSVRVDETTVPVGYDLTTANIPLAVVLAESEDYNDADFGYDEDAENASIGDYVWLDQNCDGIQDASETGLPDITVYLDLDGDTIFDADEPSDITDAEGTYDITGLGAGTYSVQVDASTIPAGYELTTANVPLPVILAEGQDYNDADFGYDGDPETASIGDYVWFDQDGDSLQDAAETGLPDITVFLDLNGSTSFEPGEPFATTGADGAYDITGLAAGTYSVRVDASTVPAGYELTTANVPLTVVLAERQDYDDADFGYDGDPQDASIGDLVWFDEDCDGVQDAAETGISGAIVYLDLNWSATLDPGELFATTGADGAYDLVGLAADTYSVRVDLATLPAGYDLTTANTPMNVILAESEDYNDADFGYEGYRLTLDVSGNGSVICEPDTSTYRYSEEVTLTAVADPGWTFVGWSGDISGDTSPATVAVSHDMLIVAVFAQNDYALTTNTIGNGSVSREPDQVFYQYGDEVILTAIPDSGWGFAGWSGDLSGTTNPVNLTMDGHKTVTAIFEWQHDLTVSTLGGGNVVLDPPGGTYSHDTVIQITALPDPGWTFSDWSGDLTGTDNPAFVTLDRDKTVTASFIYQVLLPVIVDTWPPIPAVPFLDPIDNDDGDGSYTIDWSASSGAADYLLQEATTSDFSDAITLYAGPSTSHAVSGQGAARYHYRVQARNTWMGSEWSNIRQADVLREAEPNDDAYEQANGPIVPSLVYYGTFPNGDDVNDYYFLDLYAPYRVKLWLSNMPASQNYDLVLRDEGLAVMGYSAQSANADEYIDTVQELPPGRYYVQVYHYSSGGSLQPYYLWFVLE